MEFKKHIPNIFTFLNLACGLFAIIHVFEGNYAEGFSLICLGIFFDFWDGFFARILNVSSELGVQLDSLADMVTSGVVPGFVMYKMLADIQANQVESNLMSSSNFGAVIPYVGFLIAIASCYRLAKFNIDTRQTDSFIGLPTPANNLLISSLPIVLNATGGDGFLFDILSNTWVLVVITLISTYLLNSEIYLFSLKIKNFSWEKYKFQIIFLLISLVLLVAFQLSATPLIILVYILFSVLKNLSNSNSDAS
jgi:CDP-diacylglycerol---serine O-phosphatidyltransferase